VYLVKESIVLKDPERFWSILGFGQTAMCQRSVFHLSHVLEAISLIPWNLFAVKDILDTFVHIVQKSISDFLDYAKSVSQKLCDGFS
jgi:hypothetical protein